MILQTTPRKPDSSGFTLIELITVIAIIALLAALLFPTVTGMMSKGSKAQALNNIREIAKANMQYAADNNGRNLPLALNTNPSTGKSGTYMIKSVYDLAYEMARRGYINQASIYQVQADSYASQLGIVPLSVAVRNSETEPWTLSSEFNNSPISFDLVAGNSSTAPATTPIAMTRGLGSSSTTWSEDPTQSPFGSDGGHIAFIDSHVEWFSNIEGKLVNPRTGKAADNILETISTGAKIFGDPNKSLLDGKQASSSSN